MSESLYIGLISGTSRDGLDAALVTIEDDQPLVVEALCAPYPPALREAVDELIDLGRCPTSDEAAFVDQEMGHFSADVCRSLLEKTGLPAARLQAIGSHGQTVWHDPAGSPPISLQLGNPQILAETLGVPVVSDFRSADLRAGGEGAPLAPLLHKALFVEQAPCAIVNLGGIANVTLLDPDGSVRGFDTGPANCLLDLWVMQHRGAAYDADGVFARAGSVLPELLTAMLEEPYFHQPPPKSTGLELFNETWLQQYLKGNENPADIQRTLLELTVETVATALEQFGNNLKSAWLSGGGVHNGFLHQRLQERLGDLSVRSTAEAGIHPDWIEAMLFAWLAHQRVNNKPMTTRPITGATEPVLLGEVRVEPPA